MMINEVAIMSLVALIGTATLGYLFVKRGLKASILNSLEKLQNYMEMMEDEKGEFGPVYEPARNFLTATIQAIKDGKLTINELWTLRRTGKELLDEFRDEDE